MCCRRKIFDYLEKVEAGTGGEIQLTDALKEFGRAGRDCGRTFTKGKHTTPATSLVSEG